MSKFSSQSYINAALEFENIERILLYFRVSNNLINEDILKSIRLLKSNNEKLEIPYHLNEKMEKEFLELAYYEKSLATMMYIKAMDNFENFFKEILGEIVKCEPRILKSKEKEELEFIMSFNNYEEMINAIAEKKIESLFYQGIEGIQKFFVERVGIELFKDKTEQINILMKQRNIAVHNRSKISKELVRQFPNEGYVENMYLDFRFEYVEKIVAALYKIVSELETQFSSKFNIPQIEHKNNG